MSRNCSKCQKLNDRPSQRYCSECHRTYMRDFRAKQKRAHVQTVDALAAIRQRIEELQRDVSCEPTRAPLESHN